MSLSLARPVNSNWYLSGVYSGGICHGYNIANLTTTKNTSTSYIRRGDSSQKCIAGAADAFYFTGSAYTEAVDSGDNFRWTVEAFVMSGYLMVEVYGISAGWTSVYSSTVDAGWVNVSSNAALATGSVGIRIHPSNSGDTLFVDVCRLEPYITFEPEYDFEPIIKAKKNEYRTVDGTLYTYQFGKWNHWKVPLSWVNSWDKSVINSWWENREKLFFHDEDHDTYPHSYYQVKIMNNESPFDRYQLPYFQQKFKGEMILETI